MKAYLRDYLLWRAGYRPGEKPDPAKLMFRPVPVAPISKSSQDVLQLAGYQPGQKPDRNLMAIHYHDYRLARERGEVPAFPVPICVVETVVRRSAWGFFVQHCPGAQFSFSVS